MAKAKFDIKSEATRPFYAYVGATDLAVAALREYVADVQKKLVDVQKDVQKPRWTSSPRPCATRPPPS